MKPRKRRKGLYSIYPVDLALDDDVRDYLADFADECADQGLAEVLVGFRFGSGTDTPKPLTHISGTRVPEPGNGPVISRGARMVEGIEDWARPFSGDLHEVLGKTMAAQPRGDLARLRKSRDALGICVLEPGSREMRMHILSEKRRLSSNVRVTSTIDDLVQRWQYALDPDNGIRAQWKEHLPNMQELLSGLDGAGVHCLTTYIEGSFRLERLRLTGGEPEGILDTLRTARRSGIGDALETLSYCAGAMTEHNPEYMGDFDLGVFGAVALCAHTVTLDFERNLFSFQAISAMRPGEGRKGSGPPIVSYAANLRPAFVFDPVLRTDDDRQITVSKALAELFEENAPDDELVGPGM